MADRQTLLRRFIATEQLPPAFETLAQHYYLPLVDWLADQRHTVAEGPLCVGINGCQGSGKSTLAALMATLMEAEQQANVAVLSIDDLYLTKLERQALAKTVHPLLKTRGVPGTHDIELGEQVLDALSRQAHRDTTAVPRFDKAQDDRADSSQWPTIKGSVDVIILEGWCVGTRPQADAALSDPVNDLEALEDPDGLWRHFVNQSLYNYQPLFQRMHKLIMLKAPDFNCVYNWRLLQEHKLASRQQGKGVMSDAEVARFIQHYQRLTEANIEDLPAFADVTFKLNQHHEITASNYSQ